MQYEFDFIPHFYGDNLIHQRALDGYVNATAMCKAVGKQFYDYQRIGPTQAFLSELSTVTGLPGTVLVIAVQGGRAELQGTWVHPDVAVNLGQWCSPKFAVAVAQWVREWMTGTAQRPPMPYHLNRYLANSGEVPPTHFSMLNEIIFALIGPMEKRGYTLPENMLPDAATGRIFCRLLRDEGIDTDALPTYSHRFEDGRVVPAKLYPLEFLPKLRRYIHEVWVPTKAYEYFKNRDAKALPFLPKSLPPPPEGRKAA